MLGHYSTLAGGFQEVYIKIFGNVPKMIYRIIWIVYSFVIAVSEATRQSLKKGIKRLFI